MPTAKTKTQTQEAQTKAEEAFHSAEEAVLESVDTLKKQAKDSLEDGSEKIKSASLKAENVIKERPLLSIGCAFLAGWAVSKILK